MSEVSDGLDSLSDDELNTLFDREVLHYHNPIPEYQSKYIQWEQPVVLRTLARHAWGREIDGGVFICGPLDQPIVWGFHKTKFIRAAILALLRHSRIRKAE